MPHCPDFFGQKGKGDRVWIFHAYAQNVCDLFNSCEVLYLPPPQNHPVLISIYFIGFAFIVLACIQFSIISQGNYQTMDVLLNFLPFLLVPVFFGAIFYSAYSKNMAMIRKMKTPDVKYRITDDWLYIDSDLSSGKNSWAVYKGLRKNAKIWRAITQAGASQILPVEQLDEELKAFLSEKLLKPPRTLYGYLRILVFCLFVFVVLMYLFVHGHH
jgi:hypothetical protein